MTSHMLRRFLLLLASLMVSSSALGDVIIDFDDLNYGNSALPIPQSYGDKSWLDVSYRLVDGFGNSNVLSDDLLFWENGYGDLLNVVWGYGGVTEVGEIRFDSLTPNPVTLISFDAADWDGNANNQTFRVYDGSYNLLFELTDFDVTETTHDTISPNVSAQTLILQWDFPYNVALDNIRVATVPEPHSLLLLTLSLSTWTVRRHRRNP